MKMRRLGHSELEVPHICLGTMTFGQQNSEAEAHEQLDYSLEHGINFIDTAEMYPVQARAETSGLTEKYVGSWLVKQQRDRIILASKATGPGRSFDWIRNNQLHFSRENLQKALHGSLQRLQTDYLDLYQLHWPDRNVPLFGAYHFNPDAERDSAPLQEAIETMAEFIQDGKIRFWGLSNETPWGLMTVLRLADAAGLPRPVSVQNAYNLINRSWENGLSEIAFRENISLLAYSPLGFGYLSGKYFDDPKAQGRANLFSGFTARYNKPNVAPAVEAYVNLARENDLTPTQLALAFTYNKWCVTSSIIGATSMQQLRENLEADKVSLPDSVNEQIERIHLMYPNPAP